MTQLGLVTGVGEYRMEENKKISGDFNIRGKIAYVE